MTVRAESILTARKFGVGVGKRLERDVLGNGRGRSQQVYAGIHVLKKLYPDV